METIRTTGSKRKNRRRLNIRRVILAVLALFVIAGAVIGIVFGVKSCTTAVKKRTLPFRPGATYAFTGDGFIYMDGQTLRFFSLSNEKNNYSEPLQYEPKGLIGTQQLKAIYTASSFQIVNTPHDSSFDGVISNITAGGKYIAVYVEGVDGSRTVAVYNSAGDLCHSEDFTDRVLLGFGFEGGDSDVFYTSELIVRGGGVSTSVKTRDVRRQSNTGDLYIQGQIVKRVFITKKSIFAFGTDSIVRFDRKTNKEAYRVLVNGYECIDASAGKDNRFCFLLSRSGDQTGPLNVLSVKEDSAADETSFAITDSQQDLASFALVGKAFSVRSDRLIIYSLKGTVEKTVQFESAITGAEKLDNNNIIVFTENEAILYTVK